MATSARATTRCVYGREFGATRPSSATSSIMILLPKQPRRFLIRSTGELSAESVTKELEFETGTSPVETPKGPPSLISTMNVEKALRGIAITDGDHYGRLGLQRLCPYEEVTVAYKKKVEQVMNSNLEQEELNKQLEDLKVSHSILSSVEERRLYDWSLGRIDTPWRYSWPFEADITQVITTENPPPQEQEDEGPTRLVGYFMLAWLILSFILSIALKK